jgi:hypothetical protein
VECPAYEKAKRQAKECYRKIGRVWCPALNDYVTFNDAGFRHLIWRGKASRSRKEQTRRFSLLPHAPSIVSLSTTYIEYRKEQRRTTTGSWGTKRTLFSTVRFWKLVGENNGGKISVIIQQFSKGQKHFLSIF